MSVLSLGGETLRLRRLFIPHNILADTRKPLATRLTDDWYNIHFGLCITFGMFASKYRRFDSINDEDIRCILGQVEEIWEKGSARQQAFGTRSLLSKEYFDKQFRVLGKFRPLRKNQPGQYNWLDEVMLTFLERRDLGAGKMSYFPCFAPGNPNPEPCETLVTQFAARTQLIWEVVKLVEDGKVDGRSLFLWLADYCSMIINFFANEAADLNQPQSSGQLSSVKLPLNILHYYASYPCTILSYPVELDEGNGSLNIAQVPVPPKRNSEWMSEDETLQRRPRRV
ncbi:hypothetical protein TWF192_005723 [Orbilia oligospora]|uniref:Uncharacterized protein n=1 Tax=Orbilia oligospora TaxID=2813651 RepID=A0A6G1MLS8_ORBOL|nr:hypothetical protein TWF191_003916 [Orbilia oligospora]KAF3263442.1 hypothetical protein TWF192_005723 [Orbilia oligospora]